MADFSALNDSVAALGAAYDVLAAKYNDLKAGVPGPDQQAEVDAVKAALDDLKSRIDALVA